jgi:uncharacterized Zn-binding protein involved in type VI secretion
MSVTVNPPKTPVTKGSNGIATATLPNICKMPGPPAPFVPTPLPNIGKSDKSPKGYSKKVKIDGQTVAIRGATFESMGDVASKGTGGGLISANVEGPTKFVGPGSMDVKIEGKNVQLLADPMLNNCGAAGSPPNSATLLGVLQATGMVTVVEARRCPICDKGHDDFEESEQTKASADGLSKAFKAKLRPLGAKANVNTMLGVVACKCGQDYADQSGLTTKEFCEAASAEGMVHPSGVTLSYGDAPFSDEIKESAQNDIVERMRTHLGNSKRFRQTLSIAKNRAKRSMSNSENGASYPPGACAAQKTLILLLEAEAMPGAKTEQWYVKETESPIAYKVTEGRGRKRQTSVKVKKFKKGETVPPCGSCNLLVPLLICDEGKSKCKCKKKS